MHRRCCCTIAAFLAVLLSPVAAVQAATVPSGFVDELVAGGFQTPTDLTVAPDGRIFVCEKQGLVWVMETGTVHSTPFIDLIDEVGNAHDRGLLGLTFDPGFETNGFVYLLYAVDEVFGQPDEDAASITFGRLTRYTASGDVADVTSRLVLLGHDPSDGFPHCYKSHAIGTVRFGPDGMLYAGAGDGAHYDITDGGQNVTAYDPGCEAMFGDEQDVGALRSQLEFSLAGKIVRVDPATGLGLPDNPYFDGSVTSIQSRVWVSGLRNPFRFTVRPDSPDPGTLYISDVGWSTWEELNVAAAGGENFGWPCYEGVPPHNGYQDNAVTGPYCQSLSTNDVTEPLIAWHHNQPGALGFVGNAAAGVAFYDGFRFPPPYWGACFFSDYGQSWMKVAYVDANNQLLSIEDFATGMNAPVDVEVEPSSGDLLYVSIANGEIRRIRYDVDNVAPVAMAAANPSAGTTPLLVQFSSDGTFDPDGDPVDLAWDFGDGSPTNFTANPSYIYTNVGLFTATLTVSDDHTNSAQASVLIDSFNEPPTVVITNPPDEYLFADGEYVDFRADAIDIEDGTNVLYHWEIQLVHNNHVHPEVMVWDGPEPPPFQLEGHGGTEDRISYLALVSVMDTIGLEGTDSIRLLPLDLPPNQPPVSSFFADPVEGDAPLLVAFNASSSYDPDGDLLSHDWVFGDGASGVGEITTHIYTDPGTYSAELIVTDVLGEMDTNAMPITVRASGLLGEYYDNKDLTGLALVRVDPVLDFSWGSGSPDPLIGDDTFSVRWAGRVEPRYSETYTFYTYTDDGVRLWIDGQLIVDHWVDQAPKEWSGTIALTAGQKVDLVVEYYENAQSAVAQLLWSSASQAKEVIPTSQHSQPLGPPTVSLFSPAAGASINGDSVQVSYITTGDRSGTDHARLTLDGGPPVILPTLNGIETLSGLVPGPHTVTVGLHEADGTPLANPEASASVAFTIVNPPAVTITAPTEGEKIYIDSVDVEYEVSGYLGDADHLHLNLDGSNEVSLAVASGTHTFTGISLGAHTVNLSIAGTDHLPLPNPEASSSVDFTRNVPPTATILEPIDGSTVTGDVVTVSYASSGDLSEVDHLHLQLDNEPHVTISLLTGTHDFTGVLPGPHTVTMTLRHSDHSAFGNPESIASIGIDVVESNVPPTAVIAALPQGGPSPLMVTLDASGSSDPNTGDVLSFAWDLDDDGEYDDSTDAVVTNTFLAVGDHNVGLQVADLLGATDFATVLLVVSNTAPSAVLVVSPTNGPAPVVAVLDASASSDPDPGDVLFFAWDLDDDGAYDDAAGAVVTNLFSQVGAHAVGLEVSDPHGGTDIALAQVFVVNSPPAPAILEPLPTDTWRSGQTISFSGNAIDPSDGLLPPEALSWEVRFHSCDPDAPTNCQVQTLYTVADVKNGQVVAPVHLQPPASLEFRLAASDGDPDWWDPEWSRRRQLVFDNAAQADALNGFPVLVKLDAARIDYAATAPGGADLRFIDGDGTVLAHEVETWDPVGDSYVWVRVPQIDASSATDFIWMYYGNASATDGQDAAGVWSPDHVGVWHLHDDLDDATGRGHDGTNNESVPAAGMSGEGRAFDGINDFIRVDHAQDLGFAANEDFSLGVWAFVPSLPGKWSGVVTKYDAVTLRPWYGIWTAPWNVWLSGVNDNNHLYANAVTTGWHYLAVVQDAAVNRRTLYIDGVDSGFTTAQVANGPDPLYFGDNPAETGEQFEGTLDEIRLASVAHSASWIAAQYASVTDGFVSYGAEEVQDGLTGMASVEILAESVNLTFDTAPPGLQLNIAGTDRTATTNMDFIVDAPFDVEAPFEQVVDGTRYRFVSWSDGGARTHAVTAGPGPQTYAATYEVVEDSGVWTFRRKLVFDNTAQAETLAAFPVLVKLDASRIDYSATAPGGADIRFTDPDGTLLAHEIEEWNPGGNSYVWVQVPGIDGGSSADYIWMYYGNVNAIDAQDAHAVWNNGYVGVWHLDEDLDDATANAHSGLNNGSVDAAGLVGGGQAFDGLNDYVRVNDAPDLGFSDTDNFSLGFWAYLSAPPGQWSGLVTKYDATTLRPWYGVWTVPWNAWLSGMNDNNHLYAGTVEAGWHYLAVVQDGAADSRSLYLDGVFLGARDAQVADGTDPLYFGANPAELDEEFEGLLDEIRIAAAARSGDWIAAQYLAVTDAFIGFGAEENLGDWWDTQWGRRRGLTLNNSGQTETFQDFPVLVRLDATRIDYAQTQSGGEDLRFIDPDGTELSYEIESWNPAGDSFIWVNVPQVDGASNTDLIWMYYGNPAAAPAEDAAGVWGANFVGVWHLHDDLDDATGQGHTGSNSGSTDAPGIVGDGQAFDGVGDSVAVAHAADLDFTEFGSFSLGVWASLPSPPGKWSGLVTRYDAVTFSPWYGIWTAPWNVWLSGVHDNQHLYAGTVTSGWHFLNIVQDGTANTRTLYIDGQDAGSTDAQTAVGPAALYFGNNPVEHGEFFEGTLDEIRLARVARSADWVSAQYQSVNDALIVFGPEEEPGVGFFSAAKSLYDFGGSGDSDLALYNTSTGDWLVPQGRGVMEEVNWGWSATAPVPQDYDGDGITDVAVFWPAEGRWYIRPSSGPARFQQFGWHECVPVPGDYDGDGQADIAVYWPGGGGWYLLQSRDGYAYVQFGWSESIPVPADYDGDGKTDIAVYWPGGGAWYIRQSTGGIRYEHFGWSAADPYPSDYDGDGKADVAVYWPAEGGWYLLRSNEGYAYRQFGWSASLPVPADYDRDGASNCAVFWPDGGTCYILQADHTVRYDDLGVKGWSAAYLQHTILNRFRQ